MRERIERGRTYPSWVVRWSNGLQSGKLLRLDNLSM
jgi:hypothetical protein